MTFPNKILVAVDGSSCSDAALSYAVELARTVGGTLELVHAWTPPMAIGPMVNQFTMVDSEDGERKPLGAFGQRDGEGVVRQARALLAEQGYTDVHVTMQPGLPAEVILDAVVMRRPQLLVVGTHGHRGLKLLALGSVAARLVRLSPVPTLTVHAAKAGAAAKA